MSDSVSAHTRVEENWRKGYMTKKTGNTALAFACAVIVIVMFSFPMVIKNVKRNSGTMAASTFPVVYDRSAYPRDNVSDNKHDEFPNEIMTLSELLDAYGYEVSVDDVSNAFNKGGDEITDFLTEGRNAGMALPSAVTIAANNVLSDLKAPRFAENATGTDFDQVCNLVNTHGKVVMVWLTDDFQEPIGTRKTDNGETVCDNQETYLVYGTKNEDILLLSPNDGFVSCGVERVTELYNVCGERCVTIRDRE